MFTYLFSNEAYLEKQAQNIYVPSKPKMDDNY